MRNIKGDFVCGFNRRPCVAGQIEWESLIGATTSMDLIPVNRDLRMRLWKPSHKPVRGLCDADTECAGYNNRYVMRERERETVKMC